MESCLFGFFVEKMYIEGFYMEVLVNPIECNW